MLLQNAVYSRLLRLIPDFVSIAVGDQRRFALGVGEVRLDVLSSDGESVEVAVAEYIDIDGICVTNPEIRLVIHHGQQSAQMVGYVDRYTALCADGSFKTNQALNTVAKAWLDSLIRSGVLLARRPSLYVA